MKSLKVKLSVNKLLIMMMISFIYMALSADMNAQNVAITDDDGYTVNSSAMLDVKSLTKGMLVPRMTTTQRNAIGSPATGLLVFDITELSFYFYNGTTWLNLSLGDIWETDGTNIYLADPEMNMGVGSTNPTGKLVVKADGGSGINDPLFCVVNNNNDTVFVVYPEGVRINVEDGDKKGIKGGFAVGGFSAGKGNGNEFLIISPDSIRMYVERGGTGKGVKGGFAVGGFSAAKDVEPMEFFRVTPDSVRVYLDETGTKGIKGGFAVGGFSAGKGAIDDFLLVTSDSTRVSMEGNGGFKVGQIGTGSTDNFLNLTPMNYFIGHKSGIKTTGHYNNFIGYETGIENTTGNNNTFIGYRSGYKNDEGDNNLFIGYKSGYKNVGGHHNVFIGYQAGFDNTEGFYNVYIGYEAGYKSGFNDPYYNYRNVFIGHYSGYSSIGAAGNTFVGYASGRYNTTGLSNTFFGNESGNQNLDGNGNTSFGAYSGHENTTGHDNSFFGRSSGYNMDGGFRNSFFGDNTGFSMTSGYRNSFFGAWSGKSKTGGGYNTFMGFETGANNGTGERNVFIGYQTGKDETGSNLLYIDNSDTDSPLIYGEFNNDILVFNADVGIGTTNPEHSLHISKINTTTDGTDGILIDLVNTHSNNGNIAGIRFKNAPSTTANYFKGAIFFQRKTSYGRGNIIFANNGTTNTTNVTAADARMVIEYSGDVGIGTTSPSAKLDVVTNHASGYAAEFFNDGNYYTRYGIKIQGGGDDGTTGNIYFIRFYDGDGTWEGALRTKDGTLEFINNSDRRLKENIINSRLDALKIIDGLRIVDFNFIGGNSQTQTGYIAQETEKVFPDMVSFDEETELYGVSTTRLIPVLNLAIQQQQKQLTNLNEQNKTQQKLIEDLKRENRDMKSKFERIDDLQEQIDQLKGMFDE